jgi:C1A family cysteine protease
MKQVRFIQDYHYGSVSDVKSYLDGQTPTLEDDLAEKVIREGFAVEVKFGWVKQPEDKRDYTIDFEALPGKKAVLPPKVDLRTTGFMPPVVDQGDHGTCTANAKAGVNGYMEAKQGHVAFPFSRNFIYYEIVKGIAGENPMNDPGADIRDTFAEGLKFGGCKEPTWPYDNLHFGVKPNTKAISEALLYKDISYAALDKVGTPVSTILTNAKTMLASGYPFEFGFTVLKSFMSIGKNGLMPFPAIGDEELGGHAVMAAGYDNSMKCPNTKTPGAFLIRNSWGVAWGLAGYFWMPYEILTRPFNGQRMMMDLWALGSIAWMKKGV